MYLEFFGALIVLYIENKIFMKIVVLKRVRSEAKKVGEEGKCLCPKMIAYIYTIYRYILLLPVQ
jgi:hypothetical protein